MPDVCGQLWQPRLGLGVGRWCLQMPPTSEGKASWGSQRPLAEQLLPGGPVKPQEHSQPPPTKSAPGDEARPLWIG